MNEEIILGMVGPYVKDSAITYNEFDQIFSILSRKEQYTVTDILYKNGIDLVDAHIKDDILVLDVDSEDEFDEKLEDDDFEVLYDEALFRDNGVHESEIEHLIVHKNIRQSNEILCSLIQQGNRQAAQDLCIKNKRLVDKYVIAYEKRYGNHLDFEDLEQVGFLGLIKAAQKFDIHQGTSFSTYAVFWIKQSISREIMDNGYAIRIPVHMMEKINKVVMCHNKLTGEGVPPHERILQISSQLEYSVDDVRECLKLKRSFRISRSLGGNVINTFSISWRNALLKAICSTEYSSSTGIKSPNSESLSSPIGTSKEVYPRKFCFSLRHSLTSSTEYST